MSDTIGKYFEKLSMSDRATLETRLERYREQLEAQGYEATIAEGENGFFAGVLVIDDERGRFGFLEEDGSVTWIGGDNEGIGALGTAVTQKPTEELAQDPDGLENVDVE